MFIGQIVAILAFLGIVGFFVMRSARARGLGGSMQLGIDALRAGFVQTRAADEQEPVCVVAFHYRAMSVEQVTVGVTNRRVLVVKGAGPMQAFPYDNEGEHLPSSQKKKEKRGFFDWSHGPFKDGSIGYSPTVKVAPFAGEEWRMYPTMQGFPEQTANLRTFADRFYFQWFYD